MATYTVSDFAESLARVTIEREHIARVLAAWGQGQEDYAEWAGGFLVQLQDGRYAYLAGWCDTSGWGCQDGADVAYLDAVPALHDLPALEDMSAPPAAEWDQAPADLNLWLATEVEP